jgi:hypothetical protein
LIVDRGRPVARLESAVSVADDLDGRLARLERAGVVRVGTQKPPVELLGKKPPRPRSGTSALNALLEERRRGR